VYEMGTPWLSGAATRSDMAEACIQLVTCVILDIEASLAAAAERRLKAANNRRREAILPTLTTVDVVMCGTGCGW